MGAVRIPFVRPEKGCTYSIMVIIGNVLSNIIVTISYYK